MPISKTIRFFYQLGNKYPAFIHALRFLLPSSIDKKMTDIILQGGSACAQRKLVYQNGHYTNRVATMGHIPGCNLIGYVFGEFGIGEHLRYAAGSCHSAHIPFSLYNYDKTLHRQTDDSLSDLVDSGNPHQTNLFCMNNGTVIDLHAANPEIFKNRYNIGYGFWELSDYPDSWLYAMNVLDEIWAPSRYIQEVISLKSSLPVVYMPMAVDFSLSRKNLRKDLGIAEQAFVFLFSLDFSSRIHRKNPKAVIEAFKKAFPAHNRHVTLVIKSKLVSSVRQQVSDYEALEKWVRGDPRIKFIHETYDKDRMLDLIHSCDAYVSLHRAEGFGLGMAEAMKMGKAVIATNYSGNTDFTKPENACLVDYTLQKVKKGAYYLQGNSVWADADVEQAAGYMRKLAGDPDFVKKIGKQARLFMDKNHSFQSAGKKYRKRLQLMNLL